MSLDDTKLNILTVRNRKMTRECTCTQYIDIRARCQPKYHNPSPCPVILHTIAWHISNCRHASSLSPRDAAENARRLYYLSPAQEEDLALLIQVDREVEEELPHTRKDFESSTSEDEVEEELHYAKQDIENPCGLW